MKVIGLLTFAFTSQSMNANAANLRSFVPASDNRSSCPAPSDGMCSLVYAPVQCGDYKCPYDNQCLATLANFFTPEDCTDATESIDSSCPVPSDGMCTQVYAPVQ